MKSSLNRDINKDRKKILLTAPDDTPKIVIPAVQHDPAGAARPHNLKILTETHNDEKLAITFLIVGAGLIGYRF